VLCHEEARNELTIPVGFGNPEVISSPVGLVPISGHLVSA
jgi:hypothetical protein